MLYTYGYRTVNRDSRQAVTKARMRTGVRGSRLQLQLQLQLLQRARSLCVGIAGFFWIFQFIKYTF